LKVNTTTSRPLATGLAVLFLLLLLIGLGVRFWAAERMIRTSGPSHIATDGERILLFAAGALLQLTPPGELQAVIPIARTGLEEDPVDLRFTRDGRLLVVLQRPAAVRRCDVATWDCRPAAEAATGLVERQLKILEAGQPDEWLLTDARGDMLWRLSPQQPPRAVVPAGTLAGPNDLALAGDGTLWVADTDHRRIVELVPDQAGGFTEGRAHSAVNEFTAERAWFPMMLARRPDGRWWVAQAAEFSEDRADLMVYDPESGAQARVKLPAGAYPTDIAAVGEAVFVTDMERYAVYRVAGDTHSVALFGDARLQAQLAQLRLQRERLERLSRWSLAAVIACGALMLGAAVLATPREKRWTRVPPPFDLDKAPAAVPRTAGIHWLKPDPAFERSVWWAERLGYVLFLLPVLGVPGLYLVMRAQAGEGVDARLQAELDEALLALLACSVLAVLLIPVICRSIRVLRIRLGTDGRRLYVRRPDGHQFAVEPSQLGYSDRMIVYHEYSLPLVGGRQKPIYAKGEIETWLGPLLRQARKLTVGQLLKHLWQHRLGKPLWWAAGAALLAAALVAVALLASGNS
jgi:sugar lactone lactonase YvrE